jgi:hypothetical protein
MSTTLSFYTRTLLELAHIDGVIVLIGTAAEYDVPMKEQSYHPAMNKNGGLVEALKPWIALRDTKRAVAEALYGQISHQDVAPPSWLVAR